ncbi:hypothetical protein SAVIM338S_00921 [Streptomyces avidinii]
MGTTTARSPDEPVAVIGMAARTAGADSAEELWQLSRTGTRMVRPIPRSRLIGLPLDLADSFAPYGFLIEGIDRFDAELFGISPRVAAWMDPQHRMMLELSWRTLESAGLTPEDLRGQEVAVFAGGANFDYRELMFLTGKGDACVPQGTYATFMPNRISYFYDWRGPSMTIDTACSASLTAVVEAVRGLQHGLFPLALVGAANVICNGLGLSTSFRGRLLSPTGRSVSFDQEADGYLRGDGGGCVLLKPLHAALTDGDPVYAVIRGAQISHDGRAGGVTSPAAHSQSQLIQSSARRAGVDMASLGYIEAHGTGTPAGDPIEIEALVRALATDARATTAGGPGGRLWVGSVKANVGHLEGAAGVVGLSKPSRSCGTVSSPRWQACERSTRRSTPPAHRWPWPPTASPGAKAPHPSGPPSAPTAWADRTRTSCSNRPRPPPHPGARP